MRAFFLALPLAASVAAYHPCAAQTTAPPAAAKNMTEERLSEKMYRVTFQHDREMPKPMIEAMMERHAAGLCPDGYDRVADRVLGGEQTGATEWTLRCH